MLKKMEKRVGARTQPCFTPLVIGNGSDTSLFSLIWPCWSSCSWMTMLRNFCGQPSRFMISHSPFLLTVSNALVRSTKVMYSPLFCSLHFSCSCLRLNTISVVLLFALKPHWLSGIWSAAMDETSLFSNTLARILPGDPPIVWAVRLYTFVFVQSDDNCVTKILW